MAGRTLPQDRRPKQEVWRRIPGFDGYFASNLGRVRTPARLADVVGKPGQKHRRVPEYVLSGPVAVNIFCGKTSVCSRSLRYLVCLTFRGPPPSDQTRARCIDGDPENNRPGNLRWMTQYEWYEFRRSKGRASGNHSAAAMNAHRERVAGRQPI